MRASARSLVDTNFKLIFISRFYKFIQKQRKQHKNLNMLSNSFKLATTLGCLSQAMGQQVPEGAEQPSTSARSALENEIFANYTSWYDDADQEISNEILTGTTNWDIPSWLEGIYISSGPSIQGMGKYEFDHYFDGFGRYSSFNI